MNWFDDLMNWFDDLIELIRWSDQFILWSDQLIRWSDEPVSWRAAHSSFSAPARATFSCAATSCAPTTDRSCPWYYGHVTLSFQIRAKNTNMERFEPLLHVSLPRAEVPLHQGHEHKAWRNSQRADGYRAIGYRNIPDAKDKINLGLKGLRGRKRKSVFSGYCRYTVNKASGYCNVSLVHHIT